MASPNKLCILSLLFFIKSSLAFCPEGCTCGKNDLICNDVSVAEIYSIFNSSYPNTIIITDCDEDILNLNLFQNATALTKLQLKNCDIDIVKVTDGYKGQNVKSVNFAWNEIEHFEIGLERIWPNLRQLDLSHNEIERVNLTGYTSLDLLDLSHNQLKDIPQINGSVNHLLLPYNEITHLITNWPSDLRLLNLSHNKITRFSNGSVTQLSAIHSLDLSYNNLRHVHPSTFQNLNFLSYLNLSSNPIRSYAQSSPNLRILSLQETNIQFINLTDFQAKSTLKQLQLSHNAMLEVLIGNVAIFTQLRKLDLSQCALQTLPIDFFAEATVNNVSLSGNPFLCDCQLAWVRSIPNQLQTQMLDNVGCTSTETFVHIDSIWAAWANNVNRSCVFGSSIQNGSIIRVRTGSEALLRCGPFGDPFPSILWKRLKPLETLAYWNADDQTTTVFGNREKYDLIPTGILVIHEMEREDVERYVCILSSSQGNSTMVIRLRLDLSYWLVDVKIWSVICAVFTTMGFFTINMIWAAIRRIILWRLNRLERSSRIRKMLEAMEKYRQRQREQLNETYQRKVNQVRDNYRLQVEQIWSSYSQQSERFRDYRTAQMESAITYIDTVRDNYHQQIAKIRDYGSRRMESLHESYQRQSNRARMFSLQQRLRLMRQYKIKQRYLNKLLEGIEYYWHGTTFEDGGSYYPPLDDPPSLEAALETDSLSSYHSFSPDFNLPSDDLPPEDTPSTSNGGNRIRGVTVSSDSSYDSTTQNQQTTV